MNHETQDVRFNRGKALSNELLEGFRLKLYGIEVKIRTVKYCGGLRT